MEWDAGEEVTRRRGDAVTREKIGAGNKKENGGEYSGTV